MDRERAPRFAFLGEARLSVFHDGRLQVNAVDRLNGLEHHWHPDPIPATKLQYGALPGQHLGNELVPGQEKPQVSWIGAPDMARPRSEPDRPPFLVGVQLHLVLRLFRHSLTHAWLPAARVVRALNSVSTFLTMPFRLNPSRSQCSSYVPYSRTKVSGRSEEHTSELQSQSNFVCRLL